MKIGRILIIVIVILGLLIPTGAALANTIIKKTAGVDLPPDNPPAPDPDPAPADPVIMPPRDPKPRTVSSAGTSGILCVGGICFLTFLIYRRATRSNFLMRFQELKKDYNFCVTSGSST